MESLMHCGCGGEGTWTSQRFVLCSAPNSTRLALSAEKALGMRSSLPLEPLEEACARLLKREEGGGSEPTSLLAGYLDCWAEGRGMRGWRGEAREREASRGKARGREGCANSPCFLPSSLTCLRCSHNLSSRFFHRSHLSRPPSPSASTCHPSVSGGQVYRQSRRVVEEGGGGGEVLELSPEAGAVVIRDTHLQATLPLLHKRRPCWR